MADPGQVFRRAFGRLSMPGAAPVGAPRQFGSTEHLSTEAVAAYVDGELRMNAHLRAAGHLALCAHCAAEVDAQLQARAALRDSQPIAIPTSLLGSLARIPLQPHDGLGPHGSPADAGAAPEAVRRSALPQQPPAFAPRDRRKRR